MVLLGTDSLCRVREGLVVPVPHWLRTAVGRPAVHQPHKLTAAKVKWFWKIWRPLSQTSEQPVSLHRKKTTNKIKANNAQPSGQGLEVFLWGNLEFYWNGEIHCTMRRWLGSNWMVLFERITLSPPLGTTCASFLWPRWPLWSRLDLGQQIHSPLWSPLWLWEPHLTFP